MLGTVIWVGLKVNPHSSLSSWDGKGVEKMTFSILEGAGSIPEGVGVDNVMDIAKLKGNPLVVHIWSSTCSPCKQDVIYLQKFWEKYQDQGILVLGLSSDRQEKAARSFIDHFKNTYIQGRLTDMNALNDNDIFSLPTTLFIDKNGVIVHRENAPLHESLLEGTVQFILGKKAST